MLKFIMNILFSRKYFKLNGQLKKSICFEDIFIHDNFKDEVYSEAENILKICRGNSFAPLVVILSDVCDNPKNYLRTNFNLFY